MIENITKVLKKYWGYEDFLPLQKEAMACAGSGRDSIVVLPTGGGKSLCFQAPAVAMPGLAVVVSPLISLMKDQIDALTECGVSAGRLDSTVSDQQRDSVFERIHNKTLKLLYVAPERIMSGGFVDFLRKIELSMIAIDEAHCVSMWGHDFRPEYRQLGLLKEALGGVAIHAYTATATDQVRADIAVQLKLRDPEILVGSFDRPNLVYKVRRRGTIVKQVCQVLDRYRGESGIIYCIRRKDVDGMCVKLKAKGYRVAPYHAGLDPERRKKNQESFITEKVDTIVATVAFGMGIDKSNVRYVIHAGMPKSLEHYQQESGRAGRDGLEAECCLFHSGGDYGTWKSILQNSEAAGIEVSMAKLNGIYSYCTALTCRHRMLVSYFGQELEGDGCGACDVCLGELDCIEDSLVTSQKILSCIVRLECRFGGDYTAAVLTGSKDARILQNGHDNLSTYGLLSDFTKRIVRDWTEQLIGQGYAEKTGEYSVLNVTEKGRLVLKGLETPKLGKPAKKRDTRHPRASKAEKQSWEGVDRELFEELRQSRRVIADTKKVPAFVVFGDAALRDMARKRPSTSAGFLHVSGVGEQKNKQYGPQFLTAIKEYCQKHSVEMDVL